MQLESVCSLPVDELLLTRLAFTPDGRYFLLGHKDLTLYEVLSGKAVRVFPFDAFLASISFSRDGRYVGCVNENDGHPRTPGLAKVFDMDTGGVVLEVRTRFPVEAGCFVEDPAGIVFLYKETLLQSGGGSGTDTRVRARRLPSGEPAPSLNLTGWDVRQLAAGSAVTLLGLDTTGKTYEVEGANLNVHQFQLGVCSYPACEKLRAYGLGIGAGLCRFSPDGRFLAIEKIPSSPTAMNWLGWMWRKPSSHRCCLWSPMWCRP